LLLIAQGSSSSESLLLEGKKKKKVQFKGKVWQTLDDQNKQQKKELNLSRYLQNPKTNIRQCNHSVTEGLP